MVNTGGQKRQPGLAVAIDDAVEAQMAHGNEPLRVLDCQHGLGAPVSLLLAIVSFYSTTAMMPNHCRRRKANAVAFGEESPADVDIVARLTELRIKAADRNERAAPERHIAARHMFGALVVKHNMARIAGARRDALCRPIVVGRR